MKTTEKLCCLFRWGPGRGGWQWAQSAGMNAAAAAAAATSAPAALRPQPVERAPMQQNYLQEACTKVHACTNSSLLPVGAPPQIQP